MPSAKSVPAPPAAKTMPSVTASSASSLVKTSKASVVPVAPASSLFLSSKTLWLPPSVVASLVRSSVKPSKTADEAAVFQVRTEVNSAMAKVKTSVGTVMSSQAVLPPASAPQVKTPATVSKAVQVAKEESPNEMPVPEVPALMVKRSLLALPMVVLALLIRLPVVVKVESAVTAVVMLPPVMAKSPVTVKAAAVKVA